MDRLFCDVQEIEVSQPKAAGAAMHVALMCGTSVHVGSMKSPKLYENKLADSVSGLSRNPAGSSWI